jgi:hypothetical protein
MNLWLADIESLEAISQDRYTRRVVLRMAQLTQEGRLEPFLDLLSDDPELDDVTKGMFVELAENESFLLAVADYVRRTHRQH